MTITMTRKSDDDEQGEEKEEGEKESGRMRRSRTEN